ncbi:hypothetical protein FRC01_006348 [Tulasnella sp. 417]|nr:hypothetical protein FRC01_006348 [Tulasnella sp. 417]
MSSKPGPPPPTLASDEDSMGTPMAAAAPPQLGPTPWISFSGAPNESAALFVQSVQRIAFAQNRMKDDEWIAEYASTCFAEAALAWFLSLEDEVQTSWKKLRFALVQRYPVPTPQPAPSIVPATPKASSPGIPDIGHIEVLRPEFGDFFGYLSRDSTGRFVVDPSQEKALKLKAVLHTNSKNQNEKIYSLRVLEVSINN